MTQTICPFHLSLPSHCSASCKLGSLTNRAVGVAPATLGIQRDAQAALSGLLTQVQAEFETQRNSFSALRSDVRQEAADQRAVGRGPRRWLRYGWLVEVHLSSP